MFYQKILLLLLFTLSFFTFEIYAQNPDTVEEPSSKNITSSRSEWLDFLNDNSGLFSFFAAVAPVGILGFYIVKHQIDRKQEAKTRHLSILSKVLEWIGDEESRKIRNDIKNSYDKNTESICPSCIKDFDDRLRRLMVMYDRSWFVIKDDKKMIQTFYEHHGNSYLILWIRTRPYFEEKLLKQDDSFNGIGQLYDTLKEILMKKKKKNLHEKELIKQIEKYESNRK